MNVKGGIMADTETIINKLVTVTQIMHDTIAMLFDQHIELNEKIAEHDIQLALIVEKSNVKN